MGSVGWLVDWLVDWLVMICYHIMVLKYENWYGMCGLVLHGTV